MSRVIEHFMWGYQPFFRVHVQSNAESILKLLDSELKPEVFLVGILQQKTPEGHPACVEPENEHCIESKAFDKVPEAAERIRKGYVESQLFQSHPIAQKRSDEALYRRSI